MGYAITTKYHGPTYARGSRVIATGPSLTFGGRPVRATVGWDYGLSNGTTLSESEANARAAATAVCDKLRADGWRVTLGRGATLPDDSGYVFLLDYQADGPAAAHRSHSDA